MKESVKKHLPFIVGITLLGVVTTYFGYSFLLGSVSGMSASRFSTMLFVIPCVVMLLCSFAIAMTAEVISRQLYVTVLVIALVGGVATMFFASAWMSDPEIAAVLLANSPDDATITPVLKSPMAILRDVAAWIVLPTVGCIFGAWLGSRIHPMTGEKRKKDKKKKR